MRSGPPTFTLRAEMSAIDTRSREASRASLPIDYNKRLMLFSGRANPQLATEYKFNTDDDAVSDPPIVPGGQTATVSLQAPAQAGSLDYQCDFHSAQMKGTITVQ